MTDAEITDLVEGVRSEMQFRVGFLNSKVNDLTARIEALEPTPEAVETEEES